MGSGQACGGTSVSTLAQDGLWFLKILEGGRVGLSNEDRCVRERECIRKPSGYITIIIAYVWHCVKVWKCAHDFMDF